MTQFRKLTAAIALPVFLAACAGAGIKDQGQIRQSVETATPDTVFVFRDTGFQGSATLMTVALNDVEVGKVGVNESLEFTAPAGTHVVTVKAGGLDGSLVKPGVAQIVKDGSKAHYFIVGIKQKFFGAEVTLVETTPASYLAAAQ